LIGRVRAEQLGRDDLADVRHRLEHALAAELALVAVAKLDRLVGAGGGTRRNGRAADRAVRQDDVDLDGRIAARVEDLAGVD
jgi:hypothetical protein